VSRIPRPKFTYANVVATIALFIAVGGGAAIAANSLPKNSVKSKQLAPGAVRTSDIAKDAVTGDKVKESTLGKVPSAAHADSADTAGSAASATNAAHAAVADGLAAQSGATISPSSVVQAQNVAADFSTELELRVKGFGRFWLRCKTNTASYEDDELSFNESDTPGAKAIESGVLVANQYPLGTPEVFPIDASMTEAGSREYGTGGRRLYVHFTAALLGSTKTLEIDGGGFDNEATPGCVGQLHASVSG
jgi:Na+-translocating ferredoxin:NAD+ oxidoreductase RnfG subunit